MTGFEDAGGKTAFGEGTTRMMRETAALRGSENGGVNGKIEVEVSTRARVGGDAIMRGGVVRIR